MAAQFGILAAAGVAAAVAVGGGVSYAARDAQPGDTLYPVRASIFQDVSGDATADVEFIGMTDLYKKADKAEKNNQFDGSMKADLEVKFATHIDAIEDRIAAFEAQGNTSAAAGLNKALEVHLRNYTRLFGEWEGHEHSSSSSMSSDDDMSASSASDDNNSSDASAGSAGTTSSTEASASSDDEDEDSSASAAASAGANGSLGLSL